MNGQQINQPRPFKVTIIYMVEERTIGKISALSKQLQEYGIEVFWFRENMPLTENHAAEMEEQIKCADSVIICYSKNFGQGVRGYRHQEVRIALEEQRKRPRGNAYLITVRLDKCDVPPDLEKARILDYFERDHFDKIMSLGLQVQRNKLIQQGEKIQEFNYHLSQQEDLTKETLFQGDTPFPVAISADGNALEAQQGKLPYPTKIPELGKKKKPLPLFIIVSAVLLLMGSGGAIFALHWMSGGTHSTTSANVTVTIAPSGPIYTVKNTSETQPDGVYFRHSLQSDPNMPTPIPTPNFGVFKGNQIHISCWAWDDEVYGTRVWYYAYNITHPTVAGRSNKGWLSAHYVDDHMAANYPAPRIPQCSIPLPIGG